MKNSHKGFVISVITVIVVLLVIGGGAYIYTNNKTEAPVKTPDIVSNVLTTTPVVPVICNNGQNYELTSDQRIYIDKIRMPTSYILPAGQIKLGIKNINTGEINYSLPYSYTTNEPSKIEISGNIAKDLVSSYFDYALNINISVAGLNNCGNVKQPMRIMIGDPFLGKDTAIIYPKDIIPSQVLPSGQDWADASVGQVITEYNVIKVTDIVRSLQEKIFAHKAINGDVILMGLLPSACGASGQPLGFGVGCLITSVESTTQPQWGIIFHEMGHIVENFLGELPNGLGGTYSNNRSYFGEIDKQSVGNFMYAEGIATLAALYAEKNILVNNQTYKLPSKVITGIRNQFNNDHSNYLEKLSDYESAGGVFSSMTPDVLDGIFINLAENDSINRLRWEIYPKFFKIYQNPLPIFITGPLTELQGHTYFIAGLSAASGKDLRYLFRDKWHFPIDDLYFNEIYPKLILFL